MSGIEGYREFLKRRDGTPDIYRDRLSQREIFFEKIEQEVVRSKVVFDRSQYLRNIAKSKDEPGLDARLQWFDLDVYGVIYAGHDEFAGLRNGMNLGEEDHYFRLIRFLWTVPLGAL